MGALERSARGRQFGSWNNRWIIDDAARGTDGFEDGPGSHCSDCALYHTLNLEPPQPPEEKPLAVLGAIEPFLLGRLQLAALSPSEPRRLLRRHGFI